MNKSQIDKYVVASQEVTDHIFER